MAQNTVSSEGILTKGLKSSLETTDIRDGKLRVVIDTGEIFLDIGTDNRKQLAIDIVKNLTEEQVTINPAPLPLFYYTTDTHKLMYYQNDEWVTVGDNVSHATNADTATYATNSGTATYALTADAIDWINVTNKPTSMAHSVNADTADYATNAGTSESVSWSGVTNKPTSIAHSVNSDTARYAELAGEANGVDWLNVSNKPTSLEHATNADTADYATNAGTAESINWSGVTNKPTSIAHSEVADSANEVDWENVTNAPTSISHADSADTAGFAAVSGTASSVDWSVITNKPTNITNTVNSVETGTVNGTIKVTTNGTTADVSVAGLGSAAYEQSSAFASASHTHGSSDINDFENSVKSVKVDSATNADTATYSTNASNASNDSDGDSIKTTYGTSLSINGSDISLKNKNSGVISTITVPGTEYQAGDGISLNGTTFSNAGVRDIVVNGNNINVNKNGATNDITIPYATNAGTANYASNIPDVPWSKITNVPTALTDTVTDVQTGLTQGTINVNRNGETADIEVNGLGSAAYSSTDAFAPVNHGNHLPSTAGTTSQYLRGDNTWQNLSSVKINNAGTADYATNASTADNVAWGNVSGKPSTFTPSSHNHTTAEVEDFADSVAGIKVNSATSADSATKATQDGNGNNIVSTYAPKASPAFSGTPTTPTPSAGDDSTKIASTAYVVAAINAAIGEITGIKYEVVTELPTTGEAGTIYLVPKTTSQTNNYYDEYIWIATSSKYEKIGDTEIDLSQYVNSITTNGDGNAITSITKSGNGITFTKGSTFLTEHPGISMDTDTTSTGSPSFGGTFTAIDGVTKDENGHVTKVNTKTVTIPNSTASTTSAGLVPQHNGSTAEYLRGDNTWQTLANSHNHTTANISNFSSAVQGIKVNNATTADYAVYADSANAVDWGNVNNKPTSIAYAETAGSANAVAWGNVSDKPSTFTPSSHNHTTAEITNFSAAVQSIKPTSAGTADTATTANNIPVNPTDTSGMNIWITT